MLPGHISRLESTAWQAIALRVTNGARAAAPRITTLSCTRRRTRSLQRGLTSSTSPEPSITSITHPSGSPAQLHPSPPLYTAPSPLLPSETPGSESTGPSIEDQLRALPETTLEWVADNMRPPEAPEPEWCCGSGCAHCVWDTHADSIERYKSLRAALFSELRSRETSLTSSIGASGTRTTSWSGKIARWEDIDRRRLLAQGGEDPATKAFRELEKTLKNGPGS
ncbi:hypothetical protein M427DRAFT_135958 [Gonapodya prolifera JEL478]|uniref:Oxidoreductase-like domain-containing protein n=1 Tax=Gonapodya prolifera (strain JEL478) TaxID=1344416 RepID=A0A139ABG7_GONPJ|nr:hypothetical protein M427DRAFT_135958 [Gonapodya prolifera JEL478]|eukprot:KXS14068.1 hypothetical protein M427DRAFT_135958 [Gonapodya prolifera JEL478]